MYEEIPRQTNFLISLSLNDANRSPPTQSHIFLVNMITIMRVMRKRRQSCDMHIKKKFIPICMDNEYVGKIYYSTPETRE